MAASAQGGDSSNKSTIWMVVTALIAAVAIIAPIASYSAVSGVKAGPNPNGAEIPRPADPTTVQYSHLTDLVTLLADPTGYINKHKDILTDGATQLDTLNQMVQKSTTISADRKTKLQALIDDATAKLTQLEAKAASVDQTSGSDIADRRKALSALLTQIRTLVYDTDSSTAPRADRAIQIAKDTVTANNNGDSVNGRHPIPYVYGGTTLTGMDCSGYISYIMQRVGIFSAGQRSTASTFHGEQGFQVLLGDGSMPITGDQFKQGVANGTIKPGDLITSVNTAGDPHVVMYVGPTTDSPNNVVGSTTVGSRSGPLSQSLSDRFSSNKNNYYVVRPPYGS